MDRTPTQKADLRFALLGPLRVWRGTDEITVAAGHQRLFLAVLLARAGRLADTEDFAHLLWDGEMPRTAVNMVHRYVGLLRRALEPGLPARAGGRWLLRDAGGYRLAVSASNFDLLDFREQAAQARRAAGTGDLPAALDLYHAGLSLWEGRAGAGLGAAVELHPEFVRIEREFAAAARAAADLALQTGQEGRILPFLRDAAARNPLDEAVHARLLRVLAGDGHQAEAVTLYGELRQQLSRELGIDPGPEVQAAYRAVIRGNRPASGLVAPRRREGPPPASPAFPIPATTLTPAASPVPPAQLPADLRVFVGREPELGDGARLLRSEHTMPILAYDGMPGVGKSALAVHLAHRVADHFPDGQLYADLHGYDSTGRAADPSDVLHDLIVALGVPRQHIPSGPDARAAFYRSVLAGRRVLVVLDNVRDFAQTRLLLPGTAGNAVLITSRAPLTGLATAYAAHLRRLELPSPAQAQEMLRARLGRPTVTTEQGAIAEIVERCGRLPLALAIQAARAAGGGETSLDGIAARLSRTEGTLDGFSDDRVDPDLRCVFVWSYRLLSDDAARLLRLLPSHEAPELTGESAARLAGIPVAQAGTHLTELVHMRLLESSRPGRYRLHKLVRAYACEVAAFHTAASASLASGDSSKAICHWGRTNTVSGDRAA